MNAPANFVGVPVLLTCHHCAGTRHYRKPDGDLCACATCHRTGLTRYVVDARAYHLALGLDDPAERYAAILAAVHATSAAFQHAVPVPEYLGATLDFYPPPLPAAPLSKAS